MAKEGCSFGEEEELLARHAACFCGGALLERSQQIFNSRRFSSSANAPTLLRKGLGNPQEVSDAPGCPPLSSLPSIPSPPRPTSPLPVPSVETNPDPSLAPSPSVSLPSPRHPLAAHAEVVDDGMLSQIRAAAKMAVGADMCTVRRWEAHVWGERRVEEAE